MNQAPLQKTRLVIYACALIRSAAIGMTGVLAGVYLAGAGLAPHEIGLALTVGLASTTLATYFVMKAADRIGRKKVLLTMGLFSTAGFASLCFPVSVPVVILGSAAAMLNGMGRDRGALMVLELTILPATTTDEKRTGAIAWYNVLLDAGNIVGSLLAGLTYIFKTALGLSDSAALTACFALAACLILANSILYLFLGRDIETPARRDVPAVTPRTRKILYKICPLFGIDSLAGGFLTTSLLSYFFFERFGAGEGTLAILFFLARLANMFSHIGAAWLAKRFGLVNTMVFTHIPASVLLITVPFMPNFTVAAILFIIREGLVEMDVPTRQSYVLAIVAPQERTYVNGITHLVRTGGWAVSPYFAGVLMQSVSLALPLLIGAGMKIGYDIALYLSFKGLKPPEEKS